MRLVIATPLYPPDIGGPSTYAHILEEELPKRNIEVVLVKFGDVRRLPKIVRHFAYYRRVLRVARHADAVLALDPVSVGLPAMQAAKKAKKPFVLKVVGDYAWEQGQQRYGITENLDEFVRTENVPLKVRILRNFQTKVANAAIRIIVPSKYLQNIVESWGVAREKIEVIYNAVDLPKLGNVPESVTALPRPLFVTAGRLLPWKHIDGVIDAVSQLPKGSLAVVGDGPERDRLVSRAQEKLDGRCVFTGALSHEDTLATIKSANTFVLNSSYEGLSHLLIEAYMLGVPIVATNAGGNGEVITEGVNGTLVPVGDTEALAKALVELKKYPPATDFPFTLDKMLISVTGVLRNII